MISEEYFNIHKDEMINDIFKLIRIKSDRGEAKEGMPFGEGPAKALEEALSIAASMGFNTKNYENYVGTVDFNEKEKALDILAHLDVVPVSDEWTVTKPFEPIIKDGKLYGRGASDDKGPAVTALYAMKAVKDLNIPLNKNVRLILGTDEECGSSDIKYYYDREEEAPMTFSPDADFPLINVEKGSFKPEFRAEFVEDKKLPRIVSVNSGIKVNVIPDRASAVIEGITYNELLGYCERKFLPLGITYKITEEDNKCVIAIDKIASTGLNIPRLFNIVFIYYGKAFTKTIQSIGRGLRRASDKDFVTIYDISSTTKYSKDHFNNRIHYYEDAQYPYQVMNIDKWK